jgi:indole-3-glycerol phosphate synthase
MYGGLASTLTVSKRFSTAFDVILVSESGTYTENSYYFKAMYRGLANTLTVLKRVITFGGSFDYLKAMHGGLAGSLTASHRPMPALRVILLSAVRRPGV